MIPMLVDVQVEGFSAVLPEFRSLPMHKIKPIIDTEDVLEASAKIVELVRSELAEEKADEFDQLDAMTVFLVIERWTSNEA